jgi:hypothetical protein
MDNLKYDFKECKLDVKEKDKQISNLKKRNQELANNDTKVKL